MGLVRCVAVADGPVALASRWMIVANTFKFFEDLGSAI